MALIQSQAEDIDNYFDSNNANELIENEEVIRTLVNMIYVRNYMS